jgi:TP901 family phage tail tape measure protein
MPSQTTQLIVELLDKVSAPARAVGRSLAGISRTVKDANGQKIGFGDRLDAAISRNNRALLDARMGLADAIAGYYTLKTAIGAPVEEATRFESAMADVKKVVDFPTPQAFVDFQKGLMNLSREVPVSVNGLAEIAAAAGQAGIAGADLVKFAEAAAKIGVAFDITADEAGTAMAKMMTGLNLSIDQTVRLSDAMNHLSNAQASSAAEILDVVRRVGAQSKMFGFTAEQTAAFASAIISAGAETEVAATSFRNMGLALTHGTAATKAQRGAFKALGLDAVKVAKRMQEDAVGTTVDVLERLSKLPKESQAAIASKLFGNEARGLGPLLTNLDLVRSSIGLVAEEANYAGSSFKEFANRNKTFGSAVQRFDNVLTNLKITLGNAIIPVLSDLIILVTPLVGQLTKLAAAYPGLTGKVVTATAAFVGFRAALAGLRFIGLMGRGGVLSLLAFGFNTVGRAAIGARMAATEMIGLRTALASMSGQSLGTLGNIAAGLRGMALAVPGVAGISTALAALGAALGAISAPVWGTIVVTVTALAAAGYSVWKYWDRISAVFSGVAARLGEELAPALGLAQPLFDMLASVGRRISGVWQGASQYVSSFFSSLSGWFSRETLSEEQKAQWERAGYDVADRLIAGIRSVTTRLGELAGAFFSAGYTLIKSLWDGMVQVFAELKAWLDGQVAAILAPINNAANSVRGMFGLGGGDTQKPKPTEARAGGGSIHAGRSYLVGELGPELITPSRSGYVHANGSGGGPAVTIGPFTFHNTSAADAVEITAQVQAVLKREVREVFRGVYADAGLRFA